MRAANRVPGRLFAAPSPFARWAWVPALAVVAVFAASASPALAARVKAVQRGTTVLPSASTSASVTISTVDPTRSFVVFGLSLDDAQPDRGNVTGQLTDATTVTFARQGTGVDVTVTWQVVEFLSGISVQRGSTSLSTATSNVTIAAVALPKSFCLVSLRTGGSAYSHDDFVRARLTSITNLELSVGAPSPNNAVVEWQVVEHDDASVQSGDIAWQSTETSRAATIAPVDPNRSWLTYSYDTDTASATDIGRNLIRGRLTSATTLMFDRDKSGSAPGLSWSVVELLDGTTVQRGSEAFGTSETQRNVTVGSVNLSRALAVGGYAERGGKSPYGVTDNPGVGWFTLELTSATNLRATRGLTGSCTADLAWQVIQFGGRSRVMVIH